MFVGRNKEGCVRVHIGQQERIDVGPFGRTLRESVVFAVMREGPLVLTNRRGGTSDSYMTSIPGSDLISEKSESTSFG